MKKNRGYFGIGVYHPKTEENIGTLWRTAHSLGADFIFTIGKRYRKQPSDTTNAQLHVPLFEYLSWEEFQEARPKQANVVCVELNEKAKPLQTFVHPERAIYILGAEDYGIPEQFLKGNTVVQIGGGKYCLNVAVSGSIVMYDRLAKLVK